MSASEARRRGRARARLCRLMGELPFRPIVTCAPLARAFVFSFQVARRRPAILIRAEIEPSIGPIGPINRSGQLAGQRYFVATFPTSRQFVAALRQADQLPVCLLPVRAACLRLFNYVFADGLFV